MNMPSPPKNSTTACLFTLVLVATMACSSSPSQYNSIQPNIVLIMTDDQGWGDLSMHGNTELETPNIDHLADQGAVFDRFFVSPVCSPTRAEILTGRYHVRGGVYATSAGGERLDLDEKTIAQYFKENGYQTAAFGKWHNGMQYPYHPNARGFDEFYGFCSGHWGNYFNPVLEYNGQLVKGNGYLTDDLTQHALRFMEEHQTSPFFLYLPLNTPHSPMQVPDQWWERQAAKELQNDHRYREKENLTHTKAAYAMVENIDWNVGRIVDKINQLGLDNNTIIIFLSDNGPNGWRWNGGMEGVKGSTNEGGVRSPFIIRWTGKIKAGKKIPQIASAIDVLPTLTDLTQITIEPHKAIDGRSLQPLLLEENPDWEERFIVNNWRKQISIRSQQFRLSADDQLFDMIDDPGQKIDIAQHQPDVYSKMMNYKDQWTAQVYTELPKKDKRPFPVGHPDFTHTQLPARDGTAHGQIKRSNRYPNCSYFTNWTHSQDSITWNIDVLQDGNFDVLLYYTCQEKNLGAIIQLSDGTNAISKQITTAHNPPVIGQENDRILRQESYVKDFIPLDMGTIHLNQGMATLSLKALEIPGTEAIDFRLLMLNRNNS